MGVLDRFIDRAPIEAAEAGEELPDAILTIPNLLTLSRPVLAVKARRMFINGERPVTPWVVAMLASDMEGKVGRVLDKHVPNWNIGSSKIGAEGDQYADASAFVIVTDGIIRARRVPLTGKAGAGLVLAQEGYKTVWAGSRALSWFLRTGTKLELDTNSNGKAAVVKKGGAVIAAALANDVDDPLLRQGFGAAGLMFGAAGAKQGEEARRQYDVVFKQMMAQSEIDKDFMWAHAIHPDVLFTE